MRKLTILNVGVVMALVEYLSHIDPLQHFKGLDPRLVDVTHERREAAGVPLDRDLLSANIQVVHRLVSIAKQLYPDNAEARHAYVAAWQEGVDAQRQATIGHFIGTLIEETVATSVEPIHPGDFDVSDQRPADAPPNDPPVTELFLG